MVPWPICATRRASALLTVRAVGETMAERGRKGGLATTRKVASPGLDPEELPELRTHVDALNLA